MLTNTTSAMIDLLSGVIVALVSALPGMLIGLGTYICVSWGLYTIAKRRGIRNPWLAWIPVGNLWIMGSISDHYYLNARFTTKNRRKWLLVLQIIMTILLIILMVYLVVVILAVLEAEGQNAPAYIDVWAPVVDELVGMILVWVVLMAIAVWASVLQYMALYAIYKSCDPGNATLYLVLSIFINLCQPVFLMICRNKDDGMPKHQPQIDPNIIPPAPENPWEPKPEPQEPWETKAE